MGVTKSAMKIHWRGQVGGLVGSHQYGQDTWRSMADSVANPNTEGQQIARAKFSAVSKGAAALGYLYRLGYKMFIGNGRGPRALFSKQLYDNALIGDLQSGFSIDPTKVELSKGSLTPAHSIAASVAPATQSCTVSWSDNSGVGDAEATDKLCVSLYNMTKQETIDFQDVATRAAETASMNYDASWAGDTMYVYAFWNGDEKGCSACKNLGVFSA